MTALAAWQNFYVIVGSSAGTLIGLQFVVLSLIASRPGMRAVAEAGRTYATPTIVHFGTVLGLSAILSAPWDGIDGPVILWGLVGLIGAVYSVVTAWRMRSKVTYQAEFEDWLFHVLLPFAAYLLLAASAYAVRFDLREALFGVAAAALLLLIAGIHNAWDGVTYHVFASAGKEREE